MDIQLFPEPPLWISGFIEEHIHWRRGFIEEYVHRRLYLCTATEQMDPPMDTF
jgi:hypothetical protein